MRRTCGLEGIAARWATAGLLAGLFALLGAPAARAGAFIFSESIADPAAITHPAGYTGSAANLVVTVCIDPASPNAAAMVTPLKNIVNTYNKLQPKTGNVILGASNNVPSSALDWESVGLHEVGHCLGLAHPNLASESGLSGASQDYTKALRGANGSYDLNDGADNVIGSGDDLRGDDVNLHWFNSANNPFALSLPVDKLSYFRNPALLSSGSFPANGDRTVSSLFGLPISEAVMQQGTFSDEAQRDLVHDDVASLRYAMSGLDELAGTNDDYGFTLSYAGMTNSCDIVLAFDNAKTPLAECRVTASFLSSTHLVIVAGNVFFNTGFNWFFNDVSNRQCFGSQDLTLSSQTVSTTEEFVACNSITAGPAFHVDGTGDVTFRAGSRIVLRNGFSVGSGAKFRAILEP